MKFKLLKIWNLNFINFKFKFLKIWNKNKWSLKGLNFRNLKLQNKNKILNLFKNISKFLYSSVYFSSNDYHISIHFSFLRPEDLHRFRVEHMERQLANLTGLVQKALVQNPQMSTSGQPFIQPVPGPYRNGKWNEAESLLASISLFTHCIN